MTFRQRKEAMMSEKNIEVRPVFAITERGDKSYWVRVGVAYPPNRDGSVNVELDCLPTNGRLQIRDRDEPKDAKEQEERGDRRRRR
jgi:hypothetical protein